MKERIGLLYLCTGPYSLFWEDYYKSFEKNFIRDMEKHYYVFTDSENIYDSDKNDRIHVIKINPLPWPLITLLRFQYFLSIEDELSKNDYLMFSNANVVCNCEITKDEFLPDDSNKTGMSFVQHPGYFKESAKDVPYDRNPKSLAYIPYNCGENYVIGAMFAGTYNGFITMSKILKARIDRDLSKNVIAKWHDESHLNRYIAGRDNSEYKLLSPAYCYPVGIDLDMPAKIAGVSKAAKFDVKKFKGHKKTTRSRGFYLAVKFLRKTVHTILFIKDALLLKRVSSIEALND